MKTEPKDVSPKEKRYPFYCGTQRMDWKCANCQDCAKGYDESACKWRCDLEKAIDEAYMDDGSMTPEIAKRMGEPDDCRVYNWRCPEFDPIPSVGAEKLSAS